MLNEDGYSVKGCKLIYAPEGQAGEYSRLALNDYRGCGHGCVYCYVPPIIKMPRIEFDKGAIPKKDYLDRLRKDAKKYREHGITERVLLCFTTDPYNPDDVTYQLTRECLIILSEHGLAFCTLTKGGSRALRDIDLFRPGRDAFASTLTTLNDEQSLGMEPKAALPADRLATLKRFHDAQIYTWVSLEPVYDPAMTLACIEESKDFVDFYKVGRINYHRIGRDIDWRKFTQDVAELLTRLGKGHYIKKDLQPFLPLGYDNPRYFSQSR